MTLRKLTLRSRLVVSMSIISTALVVGALFAVANQRSYLVGQVDEALESLRPFAATPFDAASDLAPDRGQGPVSDFYAAVIEPDGTSEVVLQGDLLAYTPDLTTFRASELAGDRAFTAEGQLSGSAFRVMPLAQKSDGSVVIAAVPLDQVNDAIRQLSLILLVLVAVVLLTVIVVVWWVLRLGIRPIAELTRVADTITDGQRTERARLVDDTTEAGRLGMAFNLMLDERDESEERLRTFMADASHELRTPLTSVRGFLDVIADGGFATADQRDDAHRRMLRETARMQRLIEDLLLLAQLDNDLPTHRQHVDIARLVADVGTDAHLLHPERDVTVSIPTTRDLNVAADRSRLEQALVALVDNAVTHTSADINIWLTARRDGSEVSVHVRDDGPGLADDEANRVFERFYRADRSRTRRGGSGSGLGLAIARAVVELHGGSIRLVTSPGRGCDFEIRLPLQTRLGLSENSQESLLDQLP
jgi:two-component system, OmpR family, sensor kinase